MRLLLSSIFSVAAVNAAGGHPLVEHDAVASPLAHQLFALHHLPANLLAALAAVLIIRHALLSRRRANASR